MCAQLSPPHPFNGQILFEGEGGAAGSIMCQACFALRHDVVIYHDQVLCINIHNAEAACLLYAQISKDETEQPPRGTLSSGLVLYSSYDVIGKSSVSTCLLQLKRVVCLQKIVFP